MASNKLSQTYLISEELLKLYSNLTRNVGVDKIYPYIALAQPFYIEPILGDALVEELVTQIEEETLTDENKALILKIAMPLALWTEHLAMRSLSYSIVEKGITKLKSENSEALNEKELGEYILDVKEQAEMASKLLVKFLCQCQEKYPLWRPENECDCNKFVESSGSTQTPFKHLIYFPNQGKKNCNCQDTL